MFTDSYYKSACQLIVSDTYYILLFFNYRHRVEAGIMRQVVLWDTACNFNAFISNQSIFNCLIAGESTLSYFLASFFIVSCFPL